MKVEQLHCNGIVILVPLGEAQLWVFVLEQKAALVPPVFPNFAPFVLLYRTAYTTLSRCS